MRDPVSSRSTERGCHARSRRNDLGAIGLPETATIAEAAETLLKAHISAVLVHDADNALTGVLSEGDLMRRAELGAERKRPRWLEALASGGRLAESYAHSHGRKIGEIMTRKLITVSEDAELGVAVDLMLRHGVKRLPALRGETVVGIISRSDLLKALVAALPKTDGGHPDAEIKAAIEAELDRLGWAPRASIRVEARNGVVTYSRSDHRRAAALRPPGDRREHGRRDRGARPHGLDRAELRPLPALGAGRAGRAAGNLTGDALPSPRAQRR